MIVTYACFISKFKRIVHVEKYYCYFYLDTKLNPPSIAFLDKRNTRLYNFRSTNIGKINWNYFSQYSVLGLQTADLIVTFLKKGKAAEVSRCLLYMGVGDWYEYGFAT